MVPEEALLTEKEERMLGIYMLEKDGSFSLPQMPLRKCSFLEENSDVHHQSFMDTTAIQENREILQSMVQKIVQFVINVFKEERAKHMMITWPKFSVLQRDCVGDDFRIPRVTFSRSSGKEVKSRPDAQLNDRHHEMWRRQQRQNKCMKGKKNNESSHSLSRQNKQMKQPRQSRKQYERKNQRPDINYNVHKPKQKKRV